MRPPLFRLVFMLLGWSLMAGCAPSAPPPGVLAPDPPIQVASARPDWSKDGYHFHALAEFSVRARVLSRTDYRSGREADLSPEDLALGWGRMSDTAVLARLTIRQGDRWYAYRWGPPGPPIPAGEIVRSSANMHMVPANADVALLLSDVHPGQIVTLSGALVAIGAPDGWHWRSSTTRSDTGNGACELVWVEAVAVQAASAP